MNFGPQQGLLGTDRDGELQAEYKPAVKAPGSKQFHVPREHGAQLSEPDADEAEDSTEFCRVGGSEVQKGLKERMLFLRVKSRDDGTELDGPAVAGPGAEEGPATDALLGRDSMVSGLTGADDEVEDEISSPSDPELLLLLLGSKEKTLIRFKTGSTSGRPMTATLMVKALFSPLLGLRQRGFLTSHRRNLPLASMVSAADQSEKRRDNAFTTILLR